MADMWKLQLTRIKADSTGVLQPGEQYECLESEALQLLKNGGARLISKPEKVIETATIQPPEIADEIKKKPGRPSGR
jgi:hypothetical protein